MSSTIHIVTAQQSVQSMRVSSIEGDFPLDRAVVEKLPEDSKVLSANSFGSSAWTITARINVELDGGLPKRFFLKCASDEAGRIMIEGEFNAMTALYNVMPTFVPQPHAWGKFHLPSPPTYFFLCDFIDMSNKLPNPGQFSSRLAELHRISHSPTGKFGFHIPTCHGRFPQYLEWDSSWTSFFTKLLDDVLHRDLETNGPWPVFEKVSQRTLSHVIPRLVGALEADGRFVKPSLIHGDLWEGNVGTEFETGDIYIFDAGAYYAHNEMEIGMWRCERHKIHADVFKKAYLRNSTVSEPAEEWEDRNRIYCVKMNIVHSAHHAGDIVRQTAFEDMCYLVQKYAPWSVEELDDETWEVFAVAAEDAKSH